MSVYAPGDSEFCLKSSFIASSGTLNLIQIQTGPLIRTPRVKIEREM